MNGSNPTFVALDTVKAAWRKVKGAKTIFLTALTLLMLTQILLAMLNHHLYPGASSSELTGPNLLRILVKIVTTIVSWSLIYMGIQRALNLPITQSMIRYAFNLEIIGKMVALYIVQSLLFLPLVVLCIWPFLLDGNASDILVIASYLIAALLAIYIILRLYLTVALVLAEKMGPITAIKVSFQLTKTHTVQLLLLTIINLLILGISIIPFGIGLIWSIPYIFINAGEVYKKLALAKK